MKINKKLIMAGLLTTVAAGSLLSVNAAQANENGQDSLIEKIATKFNLDKNEVQAVFDEQHEAHHQEMKQKRSEHLQSLVDEGKITADQKSALEAKLEEMHETRSELREQDLTREERRQKMQESRDSLRAWADEQGINLEVIKPERIGKRGHHGNMFQ